MGALTNLALSLLTLTLLLVQDIQGAATWGDFQRQHVLDPTANGESGYATWNRAQWNTWLQGRLNSDFGTKTINSVMISAPARIQSDFQGATLKHDGANNFYWSQNTYPIYIERLVRSRVGTAQPYDIFNCGQQYVLAGIVKRLPVHFHRSSPAAQGRPTTGNIQTDTRHCQRIN